MFRDPVLLLFGDLAEVAGRTAGLLELGDFSVRSSRVELGPGDAAISFFV